HISKPSVEGQIEALNAALNDARVARTDIGHINAPGPATPPGDVIETPAIRRTFGEAAASIPVSSTKSLHGHLMGAAGAGGMSRHRLGRGGGSIPPTLPV